MTGSNLTLFLGGARSGKSRLAQEQAEREAGALVYLATGQAFDAEMADRIARHQAERGPRWRTVDCPMALPEAIVDQAVAGRVVLVDCLTLWVSNLLLAEANIQAATDALIAAARGAVAPILFVSNEVGLGIVPDNALARRFRDDAGRLHQVIAAIADNVFFVAAGLPMRMK